MVYTETFFTNLFHDSALLCCGLNSGIRTIHRMGDLRRNKMPYKGEEFSRNSPSKHRSNPE